MFEFFERNDIVNNFYVKKKFKSDLYFYWYWLDFLNLSKENFDKYNLCLVKFIFFGNYFFILFEF